MEDTVATLVLVLIVQSILVLFLVVILMVNASRSFEANRHFARMSRSLSGLDENFEDFIHRETDFFERETESPEEFHEIPIVAASTSGGPIEPCR